jgi:hypothetical protein
MRGSAQQATLYETKPSDESSSEPPVADFGRLEWDVVAILTSRVDMPRFRDAILERAAELNYITRRDALVFAFDLALRRCRVAVILLEAANLEIPDEFLSLTSPSPE